MFDNLKKSLGLSKGIPATKGHVLGRREDINATNEKSTPARNDQGNAVEDVIAIGDANDNTRYDVTFHEEKLGLSVEEFQFPPVEGAVNRGGRPAVVKIADGSEAQTKGIILTWNIAVNAYWLFFIRCTGWRHNHGPGAEQSHKLRRLLQLRSSHRQTGHYHVRPQPA